MEQPQRTDRATPLRDLGVVGWDSIDPVIVAALATESPILLVGSHGTAKSLVLERLARALGLAFRHYNASTLNFDDLVGFPVPDGDAVRYLRTPLDVWEAEAIFVDELSRCRPDMQNRLFPLIHERRVQGQDLPKLRYRWAAMNPPPGLLAESDDEVYLGAEPLDSALADRFPWIIQVPARLCDADRLAVILGPEVIGETALVACVEATRAKLALVREVHSDALAAYVDGVAAALGREGLALSARRLRFLFENVVGVVATGLCTDLRDAAYTALTNSLPQKAQRHVEAFSVARAHKAALTVLAAPEDTLARRLLAESDPARRIALALGSPDDGLLGATLLDARAAVGRTAGVGISLRLFPRLVETRPSLPGVVFEALADDLTRVEQLEASESRVATNSPLFRLGNQVSAAVAELGSGDEWIADVLWAGLRHEETFEPSEVVDFCRKLDHELAAA